jgi:hypothetical protein
MTTEPTEKKPRRKKGERRAEMLALAAQLRQNYLDHHGITDMREFSVTLHYSTERNGDAWTDWNDWHVHADSVPGDLTTDQLFALSEHLEALWRVKFKAEMEAERP